MKYEDMSGPELVRTFNEMANSKFGRELGARTVSRFKDIESGRARCLALESSIKARGEGLRGVEEEVKTNSGGGGDIFATFKTNTGKNRGKLLAALASAKNSQVKVESLLKAVYNSSNKEARGKLMMVMKGLTDTIDKKHLPFQVKKEREGGETSYGLYDK